MRVHLTGIGGTGMGALAGLLLQAGHEVRGSDGVLYPPISELLADLGISVFCGYRAENLDWEPDLVVLGNSCRADHVEYAAARARALRVVSFPELLGELYLAQRTVCVVAGTHGKTTTTSLLAHVLRRAGHDPGYLVGGVPLDLERPFAAGSAPYFVVEGDEYDCACFDKRPKFVHYRPAQVILTSVELDHVDIYASLDAVEQAFVALVERVPEQGQILVCTDYPSALRVCAGARARVLSYAVQTGGNGRKAADWEASLTGATLTIERSPYGAYRQCAMTLSAALCGLHNANNALAVVAQAATLDVPRDIVTAALSDFRGVKRRQQVRGVVRGVTVIDDFAHHPTAVRETLRALRGRHGAGELIAVFEPRSGSSRRRAFQAQFPQALAEADRVFVAPVFAADRLDEAQRLDAGQVIEDLRGRGRQAQLLDAQGIVDALGRSCRAGDTVVVMSSGGFDNLIERLLEALEA